MRNDPWWWFAVVSSVLYLTALFWLLGADQPYRKDQSRLQPSLMENRP